MRLGLVVAMSLAAMIVDAETVNVAEAQSRVLVYTAATEGRVPTQGMAADALTSLGAERGFVVDVREDAAAFERLDDYAAVVFLHTSGNVLDDAGESALRGYVESGGGFLGIGSAAETEPDWEWYAELLSTRAVHRSDVADATAYVLDPVHPATRDLSQSWSRTDRWLDFEPNPRGRAHVVATVDEASYEGGMMGHDHPIAWCRVLAEGRSFYVAGGYTEEAWADATFREHLGGALDWVTGLSAGDCTATVQGGFAPQTLADGLTRPTQLDIASDGSVFIAEIAGRIVRYEPTTGALDVAAQLDVWTSNEGGLLGLALDPRFDDNGWIYAYYSPADADEHRLSRFDVLDGAIEPSTERVVLRIPIDRERCCHHAGGIVFGPTGDLFIATGNNTDPFESNGFSESDERPGRELWDAQRTSANTDDLRGKVLRIHPEPDGTYSLPIDNLFPPDGSLGRPEIFAMGVKNPFRISVDPLLGWLYVGDVGPDARAPDPMRGPMGFDEINQLRGPANLGWPYCVADNRAYREFDFETRRSGPAWDCSAPVNDSPNNTGRVDLPPAQPAWIFYPYDESTEFPAIEPGRYRAAMAGPVIRHQTDGAATQPPRYYDGLVVFWDWTRSHLYTARLADDDSPLAIHRFIPELDWQNPIDVKVAPDGTLYALSWGSFADPVEGLGRLMRIDYVAGRPTPIVAVQADRTSGPLPLTVRFDSEGTIDPEGAALSFEWDLDGDGLVDAEGSSAEITYADAGAFVARLTVSNPAGARASATVRIVAGNTAPVVSFESPDANDAYLDGEHLSFRVRVTDAEDGTSDDCAICSAVVVRSDLGHGTHTHPITAFEGCEGSVRVEVSHEGSGDLFWVLEASYTDRGGDPGAPPITSSASRILLPVGHPDAGPKVSTSAAGRSTRCAEAGGLTGGGCRTHDSHHGWGLLLMLLWARRRTIG